MVTLKKYDLQGKEVEQMEVDEALLKMEAHPQSVKDYIVAIRKNGRQWSACTKVRREVNHTGRKPRPQKGQGRSRQGDLAAPQYRGGGVVFGPKPKFNMRVRINKKERRAAIRSLLTEKIKEGNVAILVDKSFETPKTKTMAVFFVETQIARKRVLVLGGSGEKEKGEKNLNLVRSLKNLPKKEYFSIPLVNGYELARASVLVVLDSALDEFLSTLGAS